MQDCIAVIQLVSGADPEANLACAQRQLAQASEQGARLAVLPENFALLESDSMRALAEREYREGFISQWLAKMSRFYGLWLVAGSVPMLTRPDQSLIEDGRVRSACRVFDDQGREVARYDKRHLFDVFVGDAQGRYQESARYEAGDQLVVVPTPVGKLGLSICYDLRFPEHFQRLRAAGAELISVPSAFTYTTGQAHWQLFLQARAVETQCYLLGANQGGQHSEKRQTWGHSIVVSPWGEVLAELAMGEGCALAQCDLQYLEQVRQQMPLLEQRCDPLGG